MEPALTPADKAVMVLTCFKHHGLRAGETISGSNLVDFAARKGWRNQDMADGVEHGGSLGWFVPAANVSTRLTDVGYAEIRRISAQPVHGFPGR